MTEQISEQIDQMFVEIYPDDQPGAAVIVTQNGETLFRKGYGLANLELGVKVEPEMIFRLGSITKQFTAVAILMLQEEGKLQVQDEITRYLPDYPVGERKITIEHLLQHTSGIKSYTDMVEWLPLWRKDMSVQELIDLFKEQPFDFEPGEQFRYDNSGYILLGAIIEALSGSSYADFIQEWIFKPLGMQHSLYDNPELILPGRVSGYSKGLNGLINAPYLSMTQPYAAGSLRFASGPDGCSPAPCSSSSEHRRRPRDPLPVRRPRFPALRLPDRAEGGARRPGGSAGKVRARRRPVPTRRRRSPCVPPEGVRGAARPSRPRG